MENAEGIEERIQDVVSKIQSLSEKIVPDTSYTPREFGLGPLFHSIRDAVIVASDTGRIALWSSSAQMMFGWTEEEALGQGIDIIVPEDQRYSSHLAMAKYRAEGEGKIVGSGQPVRVEACRKDGTKLIAEIMLDELHTRIPGKWILGVVRDVTNVVQFERATIDITLP